MYIFNGIRGRNLDLRYLNEILSMSIKKNIDLRKTLRISSSA